MGSLDFAPEKHCRVCNVAKPLTDFYEAAGARDGRRNDCKACNLARRAAEYAKNPRPAIARAQRWAAANPERMEGRMRGYAESGKKKLSDRKSHLKRKYGLTLDDFDLMLAAQGGGCAICGERNADNVDHNHTTGVVRGILCFNCNAAIGQLGEDSNRLAAAISYLDRDDELAARARTRALALTS
ncbi:MAG: endonuclease VII domain-containing protein [Actinomycetota bacterium]